MNWKRIGFILGALLILFGLAYGGYVLFQNSQTTGLLPGRGEVVTFVESGIPERYSMNEQNVLKKITESYRQTNIVTYEHVASPFSEDERIALAISPDVKGAVLGIFKADDSLDVLVSGETNKADLLVTKDGIAVYSAQKVSNVPAPSPAPDVVGTNKTEDTTIEKGHAGPPGNLSAYVLQAPKYSSGDAELYAVNIKTGQIRPLGSGRSPRLLPDGSVIALAHEGVVIVNPETGARSVILRSVGADGALGGISKSGNTIAVANPDGQSAGFFRLNGDSAHTLTHTGRLEKEPGARSVAFLDDARFFVHETPETVQLFSVPTEKMPIAIPGLVVALLQ